MRQLIQEADAGILEDLILQHCKEDRLFYLETLFCLGGSSEDEYGAIKDLVEDSIDRNIYRGQLNKSGCAEVCNTMMTVLKIAQHHLDQKRYAQVMDIAFYIFCACVDLMNRTNNTSDPVWNVFGSSSRIFSRCTAVIQKAGSIEEKQSQALRIVQIAKAPAMLPWRDLRCDLLTQALPLASESCAEEIFQLLQQ